MADDRFRTNDLRRAHRDELRDLLNARFRTRSAIAWTEELTEAGVPAGPVYTLDQVFADPQVREQGMVEEIEHPVIGALKLLSNPIRMDAFEAVPCASRRR